MAYYDVTIQWNYVLPVGDETTLVQYRQQGNTTWITPTSSPNPTTNNYYTIPSLDGSIVYEILLTHSSPTMQCSGKTTYFTIVAPSNCYSCPSGYTLSPDNTYCYSTSVVSPTPPSGTPSTAVAATHSSYSTYGTIIMNPGYTTSGGGSINTILTSSWWKNVPGDNVSGPLNRCGLWASTATDNQDVGFSVSVNFAQSTTYYIGIAGDNYVSIKLDGNIVVQQDVTTLEALLNNYDAQVTFKYWWVYPVTIPAGPHIIEMVGHNDSYVASMGAEIYNNTLSELSNAASYSDLNLVFSTKNMIGQPIQIGSGGFGYTCPSGYALDTSSTPYTCKQITTVPSIPC